MRMSYDDWNERIKYYCVECNRGVEDAPSVTQFLFCPYCGHKYNFDKVNLMREKIAEIVAEG